MSRVLLFLVIASCGSPAQMTGHGSGGEGGGDETGGSGGQAEAPVVDAGSTPRRDSAALERDTAVEPDAGADAAPASPDAGAGGAGGASGEGGMAGCAGDPRAGWTEFMDTFKVQHPYDLMESDRFKLEDGMYTLWVFPTDKAHQPGNTTAPRTEMRWSNWTTGERMWEADMMFESPLTHTCVMQIHNVGAAIAAYMQVNNGELRNAAGGGTFLKGYYDKWFNMKVAFNPDTLQVRTWVNNCLIGTTKAPKGPDPNWYFKNGVYTCNASICRDHFKNIRFWKH
jgi:Alginate lyase